MQYLYSKIRFHFYINRLWNLYLIKVIYVDLITKLYKNIIMKLYFLIIINYVILLMVIIMIIKELFTNFTILISMIFLYTQLTNSSPLNRTSSLSKRILIGILGGLLSNILMFYSMPLDDTIIDLRHIPSILLSFYSGAVPALISMILVIVGRFLIGINTSSYAAVILIVSITFISLFISKSKLSKNTIIVLILTFSNIIYSVLFVYLIQDASILISLIPIYWAISFFAGFIAFYIVEYLRNSQELLNRYKTESTIDGLTGLNNVRKFDEVFNNLLDNLETKNEMLSLLYIDIDFFKKINDTYGHKEGDLVLKELGLILKSSSRSFDIVSRNGGEEFTVILLDCPLNRAEEISEHIRTTVENHVFMLSSGKNINITISIGVACFDETTSDPTLLIEDADKALYHAKRTGRNRVCVSNKLISNMSKRA
jgi:diguanylate cyclase